MMKTGRAQITFEEYVTCDTDIMSSELLITEELMEDELLGVNFRDEVYFIFL